VTHDSFNVCRESIRIHTRDAALFKAHQGMQPLAANQTGWKTKGVRHLADPSSKMQMGPQRVVARVCTSKSGVGMDAAKHAIRCS